MVEIHPMEAKVENGGKNMVNKAWRRWRISGGEGGGGINFPVIYSNRIGRNVERLYKLSLRIATIC